MSVTFERDAAPRPWDWTWVQTNSGSGGGHVYLVDANGRKIAAIWGPAEEKQATADLIVASVNAGINRAQRSSHKYDYVPITGSGVDAHEQRKESGALTDQEPKG